jgi:hypothetical protein
MASASDQENATKRYETLCFLELYFFYQENDGNVVMIMLSYLVVWYIGDALFIGV